MAATATALAPRHWVYLDEGRTHEIHAEVERLLEGNLLVTTEFPAGSLDPNDVIQTAQRVAGEAEVAFLLSDLEARLRLTGRYFRADAADMRWRPLGDPPPGARLDLRGIELPLPGAKDPGARMRFHHFHAPRGVDRLLITMPRMDQPVDRHVLAQLEFRFPEVDAGDIRVLHPRLSPSTLNASLVKEHLELPRRGFAKLVDARDYEAAFGEDWQIATRAMLGRAANRMAASEPGALVRASRREAPGMVHAVTQVLQSPRLAGLKRRFLAEGEEEHAVRGGELAIRRLVMAKRREIAHTAAYELSVLEASLLLRYALEHQVWSLVEEEGAKVVRFVNGYA